ncbi:MAG: 4Fe-4S binding protein [Planctomycetes bacterium]|nr:4Fe-4S binding protein [Planctomycetota bacterium]
MSKLACRKVTIDFDRCKACGLCLEYCPAGALTFSEDYNSMGLHPVEVTDASVCTGCGFCALVCPDAAIEISEE